MMEKGTRSSKTHDPIKNTSFYLPRDGREKLKKTICSVRWSTSYETALSFDFIYLALQFKVRTWFQHYPLSKSRTSEPTNLKCKMCSWLHVWQSPIAGVPTIKFPTPWALAILAKQYSKFISWDYSAQLGTNCECLHVLVALFWS